MDLGSLFLLIALCIPVALFIVRPLLERKSVSTSPLDEHDRSHLLAERDRTLNALQELDFDYTLGKIPEEDYPATRAWLVQSGAETLRKLDEFQPAPPPSQALNSPADTVEAAIALRRQERAADSTPAVAVTSKKNPIPDDSIETLIAARRQQHNGKSAGFCHKCGNAVQKEDLFCPKCGARLKTAA